MNENNIIQALNAYDGTQPSLEKTVGVLAEELGPEWTSLVFQQLGGLSVELKEKLDHAFNYYASLTAWQEAQSYLLQEEPLDSQMMGERMPVLHHWLEFFGQPGQDLYKQLEERVARDSSGGGGQPVGDDTTDGDQVSVNVTEEQELSGESLNVSDEAEAVVIENDISDAENQTFVPQETVDVHPSEDYMIQKEVDSDNGEHDDDLSQMPLQEDTPEAFAIHKAERQIVLLDDLQSWLAARCVQLGDIEVFAYPYYGMLVDLMRQTVKDIQAVFDLENQDIVSQYYPDGLDVLHRKKQAIESDIQVAVENCESDTTALIDEGMDINKVKKALGDLDTSTDVEYAGPAPDGFELMDDEQPIDEEAVKKQYERLEKQNQKDIEDDILSPNEKSTSQNEQNSVQRKLSFSLKPKKG